MLGSPLNIITIFRSILVNKYIPIPPSTPFIIESLFSMQQQPQPQLPEQADNPVQTQIFAPISTLLKTNSFIDRYFTRFYTAPQSPISQYLYLHTNGIAIIGITANQLAGQQPLKVSYDCLTDNISDIVKGKKKKGTVKIQPQTNIAHVTLGETVVKVKGLIDGQVVEFNQKLISNPKLLMESPEEKGYLIIVLPKGHVTENKYHLIKK